MEPTNPLSRYSAPLTVATRQEGTTLRFSSSLNGPEQVISNRAQNCWQKAGSMIADCWRSRKSLFGKVALATGVFLGTITLIPNAIFVLYVAIAKKDTSVRQTPAPAANPSAAETYIDRPVVTFIPSTGTNQRQPTSKMTPPTAENSTSVSVSTIPSYTPPPFLSDDLTPPNRTPPPPPVQTARLAVGLEFRGNPDKLSKRLLTHALSKVSELSDTVFAKVLLDRDTRRPKSSIRRLADGTVLLDMQNRSSSGTHKTVKKCYRLFQDQGACVVQPVAFLKHHKYRVPSEGFVNPYLRGFSHPNVDSVGESAFLPSTKGRGLREANIATIALGDLRGSPEPLTPRQRIKISLDLLKGLCALQEPNADHPSGLVHQDIKTENCLLYYDGTDYIAKISDCTDVRPEGLLRTGGTPGLLAPESRIGIPISKKEDIFAMGKTIEEILEPSWVELAKNAHSRLLLDPIISAKLIGNKLLTGHEMNLIKKALRIQKKL